VTRIGSPRITSSRPLRGVLFFLALLLAIVVAAGVYLAPEWVRLQARGEALAAERQTLREANAVSTETIAALRRGAAETERARQVELAAYTRVDQRLRELQDEVLSLKEEVDFYQRIVSSAERSGLNVQTFVVDREDAQTYRYQLVLTRFMKSDKVVEGEIRLTVSGEQDGRLLKLAHDALSGEGAPVIEFRFKHFQRLEGKLALPPGFVPQRITIKVKAPDERPSTFERSFEWSGENRDA
jgi:hypothetical protein